MNLRSHTCNEAVKTGEPMRKWLIRGVACLGMIIMVGLPNPVFSANQIQGKKVIVIDPAHGGSDRGVELSGHVREKDFTLQVARLMEKELVQSGQFEVRLTRTADTAVSMEERLKIIRSAKADVVISLHVNAGFDKKSSGYEIYFPGFKSLPGGQNDSKAILKDMVKNKYLNDSVRLAQMVGKNLTVIFPRKNRGLRDAPVPLLEGLTIPAVVVEVGFATNTGDCELLLNETTKQALAKALSKGIRDAQ
jgi:N-acetylmuramoyl-L-alanine amidase